MLSTNLPFISVQLYNLARMFHEWPTATVKLGTRLSQIPLAGSQFHGLPTAIREISGLAPPSVDFVYYLMPWIMINTGALTKETTATSLIRMFIVGPEVSLKGSPTVSPTTAAL